ncbi:MAG: hypothetical protein AC479_07455 [miscellaneous Crenarchaeota group-6 archaeon AD8-1]|nr:MAG: hypothetical protein AC479_07455 [miscellaneous Crenarchaeota group-6 archaeon AD8-1]
MSKNSTSAIDNLEYILHKKNQEIIEQFGKVMVLDVKDSRILNILKDVIKYWNKKGLLFRPALTSFSCEAVGGNSEIASNVGLIFTIASAGYGLHDDILDKSNCKHLQSTILGLHGLEGTLLVGDLLIIKAWFFLHKILEKYYKKLRIKNIIDIYGSMCIKICEAEFKETLCRRKLDTSLNIYQNILWQEMAETEVCSRIGAILGNGQKYEIEALAEFGRRLGFMSRLGDEVEDCLNVKGDLPHRLRFESVPLPLLYAAKSSTKNYKKINRIIIKKEINSLDVRNLLQTCFETEAFYYVRDLAKDNHQKAMNQLNSIRPSDARAILSLMMQRSYFRVTNQCI